jgi:hypothetical protein
MIVTKTKPHLFWRIYSYLLHPLFIPVYMFAFLIYYCPNIFLHNTYAQTKSLMANVLLNLVFFPAFTVFLLKQLKFISSYHMESKKERTISIFMYTIYSFWVWAFVLLKNPANYDALAIKTGLAIFITSSIALICNSFYKISLHMIGAGMTLGLSIIVVLQLKADPLWILFGLLMATTIFLCRKKDSDHSIFEIYSGFMCGLLTMVILQFLL